MTTTGPMTSRRPFAFLAVAVLLTAAACTTGADPDAPTVTTGATAAGEPAVLPLVPWPSEVTPGADGARLTAASRLVVTGPDAAAVADVVAADLRDQTGLPLPVVDGDGPVDGATDVVLAVGDGTPESYELSVAADGVELTGADPAGLFYAVQTLRQLLPVTDGGPVDVPGVQVTDAPRYAYRGAMLDVARHFFTVEDVQRYVDHLALAKINVLHLHLTDDQGWRIEIDGWPELTGIGASTSVDGDGGGHYTQEDYRAIVEHAAARHVTVVPEIDLPGHTNAALAAYPELACDGVDPVPYEGIEVGFSTLCPDDTHREVVDRFVTDVLGQVAGLTPGPWLHVGGDESHATTPAEYVDLVERITAAAAATGKTPAGWMEIGASTTLPPGTVGQYWDLTVPRHGGQVPAASIVDQGGSLVLSPADAAYVDMRYPQDLAGPEGRDLGLEWADGPTSLDEAYSWDPADVLDVDPAAVLGVEAPLWTETVTTLDEIEFMAFPRLLAVAEIGWSPAPGESDARTLDDFIARVAGWQPLLDAEDVDYAPVDEVPWPR